MLCYGYFRLGKSYPHLSVEQRVLKGLELCNPSFKEVWQPVIDQYAIPHQLPDSIFSWKNELGSNIDAAAFEQAHLQQPHLFLRIRPGYERDVVERIKEYAVTSQFMDGAVCLPNGFKAEKFFRINKEVVVQDLSSQRVGELLSAHLPTISNSQVPLSVWDCCAASGGKSILAKDKLGNIQLTVSDIRPSILANLKKRFQEAGMLHYNAMMADAAQANPGQLFDLVIADVPCSGSGTWARTPEQLLFFDERKMNDFVELQSAITRNIVKYIRPGGHLLYITCSVFEKENEYRVQQLQTLGLELVQQKTFRGYEKGADTLFGALLRK